MMRSRYVGPPRRRHGSEDSTATGATRAPKSSSARARLPRAGGRHRRSDTSSKVRPIGVVLVTGLLLAACGSSSPGSGSSSRSGPTSSAASAGGVLDPCLVGTWIDRGESDTLSYQGMAVTMHGLAGKTVTFSPSGNETVGFARAVPLEGSVGGATYAVAESGTITDHATSSAGILSFSDVSYTAFSETATVGGASTSPPEPPPPTPDRYTCHATTMSLSGTGLHATFSRSSSVPASPGTPSSVAEPTPVTSALTAAGASAIPDLFVYTAAIAPPGELLAWPEFPTTIQLDDNDWISEITWSAGPQSTSGSGTFYTDLSCSGPAASCPPTAEGTVELTATLPETCTVTFADPSTGAQRSEQAYVFDRLEYRVTSGPTTGQVYAFSSPCSQAPRPPGRCRTSVLSVKAYGLAGGGAAGSQGGAFGIVDHGTAACTMYGYPGMQLLGADGEPLPTTVIRGQYEVVDAVPEQTVTLSPGAEAFFYYMYSDVLVGGCPAACSMASALEITPPNDYHHLVVSVHIAPSEGRIWVSPVTTSTPFPLVSGSP